MEDIGQTNKQTQKEKTKIKIIPLCNRALKILEETIQIEMAPLTPWGMKEEKDN